MTHPTSHAAPAGIDLDRTVIRAVFMQHGFTIKEGQTDLKPYVYEAAEALISLARSAAQAAPAADERAAFEAWVRKDIGMPDSVPFNWDTEWVKAAFEGWQARAALAQQPQELAGQPPQHTSTVPAAQTVDAPDDLNGGMHASIFVKVWGDAGGGDAGRIALANYAYELRRRAASHAPVAAHADDESVTLPKRLIDGVLAALKDVNYLKVWEELDDAVESAHAQQDAAHISAQITADAECILRLLDTVDKLVGSVSGATESIQEHAQHIVEFAAKIVSAPSAAPGKTDPANAGGLTDCAACDGHGCTHYPDGEWQGKCAACKGTGIDQSQAAEEETTRNEFAAWITGTWRPDDGAELLRREWPAFAFAAFRAGKADAANAGGRVLMDQWNSGAALLLFQEWKGYPLPEFNADGNFDKDWLHREWVAFQAGMKRRPSPATSAADAKDAGGLPHDVEFKRLADTILQATTNGARLEALRGMAQLFDRATATSAADAKDAELLRLIVTHRVCLHFEGRQDSEDDAVWADELMKWSDGDRMGATRALVEEAIKQRAAIAASQKGGA